MDKNISRQLHYFKYTINLVAMATTVKTCKRNGCRLKYADDDNTDSSCKHHSGKPMFHDLKKGWTCCDQRAYDWDEFERLPACAVGRHTDVSGDSMNNQDDFFKSSTVSNAQKALDKDGNPIQVRSIDDYNREQEEKRKREEAEKAALQPEKKVFINDKGMAKCTNKGCNKDFDLSTNTGESCKFHDGQPCFHDLKKFWSCCRVESYDWDDFMKLPTCQVGKHQPKYA